MPVAVTINHHHHTLAIDTPFPRISWKTTGTDVPKRQHGYKIRITRSQPRTYAFTSSDSVLVSWPGEGLASRERLRVAVAVRGEEGGREVWSEDVEVEAGLLQREDWVAKPICPISKVNLADRLPVVLVRKVFHLGERNGEVETARLYVTALGVYEVEINGMRVGNEVMAPGWTSYGHRIRYQTFDVRDMMRPGENVVGALFGEGWYRGRLSFNGGRKGIYGEDTALLLQLEIIYRDGRVTTVSSDDSWKASTGPILYSEIYDGEKYDARLEKFGWSSPGYAETSDWTRVRELPFPTARLVTSTGPPVRCSQTLAAVKVFTTPAGKTVVDFGQNLVGWLRIKVSGPAGHTITIVHTEVLEKSGEVATRPLREAMCTDIYTLKGGGEERWEPRFTFHGFRYAQVDGWPEGQDILQGIEAMVLHTDMKRTGWFQCSDEMLNKLHRNITWSMRGNFLEIPTDCPQRDERLGWTGDLHVFSPTATFLYDCCGMLQGWLRDLSFEQADNESCIPPLVVPDVIDPQQLPRMAQAVWQDAAIVVPWVLYNRYGDIDILREQYPSMKAWLEKGIPRAPTGLWEEGFQFGDWLDPAAPGNAPQNGRTDPMLVANAFLIHITDLMSEISILVGDPSSSTTYAAAAAALRDAFRTEYLTPCGRLSSDSQTAYVLALRFKLFSTPAQISRAASRLAEIVRTNKFRICTGFAGTPYICDTLTSYGYPQLAYRMLHEKRCPSWLYPITMGATTIWERWDSMLPDGSINPASMTSFNHYALGAVADWMHGTIGGVTPALPGWKKIRIAPVPGGEVKWAEVILDSPYGEVYARWGIAAGRFKMTVRVPCNATAEVILPQSAGEIIEVGVGTHDFDSAYREPEWPLEVLVHPYMPDEE